MPATRRTSGMPTSRKTTSADRGLPGSPITGTPSHSASSVGLPGLIASPWHQMPGAPSRPDDRRRSGPAAPTDEPGRDHDHGRCRASASRSARLERGGVVGDDAARHGLAARLGDQRGERRRAVASRTWPGRKRAVAGGTTSSPVETIATRGRACDRAPR